MQRKLVEGTYFAGVAAAARELGMSRGHLTRLLHGRVSTTPERAREILAATGVRVPQSRPRRRRAAGAGTRKGGAR